MYAILALVLIGMILCGAHAFAALMEIGCELRKDKPDEVRRSISDAQENAETGRSVIVDQRHTPQQPHAFDVHDFFQAGRR